MKRVLGKILSGLIAVGGWLFAGARIMLDLIGYSTVPEDVAVAKSRLDQALSYFLSIPWWAILGFALISTLWLMWVSWSKNGSATEAGKWVKSAHLKLQFNSDITHAVAMVQQDVALYYWTHIPGILIDFDAKAVSNPPGYALIFLSFGTPTQTNYNRLMGVGGGIQCEVLINHPHGAVVRAIGDLRGRTLDMKFSGEPVAID